MDNSKIIERVRRLLAMAADVSSEHEAAIAARRATKLMREYNLSMAEVIAEDIRKNDSAIGDEDLSNVTYKTRIPQWLQSLAVTIADLFSCKIMIRRDTEGQRYIRIYGYKTDIEVAKYVFMYLMERVNHFAFLRWEENYIKLMKEGFSGTSWKREYMLGMVVGLKPRLADLYASNDASSSNALIVLKSEKIAAKYGIIEYGHAEVTDNGAYSHGYLDSDKVALNKGLDQNEEEREIITE